MKFQILAVGQLKQGPEKDLLDQYRKRITWPLTIKELTPRKPSDTTPLILENIPASSAVVALDERGKNFSSLEFSELIQDYLNSGIKNLSFLIGGADGFEEAVRAKADHLISFGRLTWPHMLVRALLVEQLYRCQQIINRHPYHRE
jgi:23S rRNA (pseudouridine1915-N3)-methyltransferase